MRSFFQKLLHGLNIFLVLTFLVWVERNCSLPLLPIELGWPWISLAEESTSTLVLWNSSLLLICAAFYFFPFLRAKGVLLVLLMGLWQSTGQIFWVVPIHSVASLNVTSLFSFWAFVGAAWFFRGRPSLALTVLALAVLVTPLLTLDRLLVGMGVLALSLANQLFRFARDRKAEYFGSNERRVPLVPL